MAVQDTEDNKIVSILSLLDDSISGRCVRDHFHIGKYKQTNKIKNYQLIVLK